MPVSIKDLRFRPSVENAHSQSLFHGLAEDEMQLLLGNSSLQNFEAGKILVQQGDLPKHLYYVVEGTLKTIRSDAEGKEATIRLLKSGDTCMDAVIFMGSPSPVAVQVMDEAKVLLVPEAFVRSYVLKNPQFATNMLHIVTKHYKNALHQLDGVITKPPVQRLGYYLLKLHLEQGNDKPYIELPFQKQSIANHLGMTPETFSRALKEIRNYGINIDHEYVSLRDAYALCHFCDTDTAFVCPDEDKASCPACPHKNSPTA